MPLMQATQTFFVGRRKVTTGDVLDAKDPIVKGRASLFRELGGSVASAKPSHPSAAERAAAELAAQEAAAAKAAETDAQAQKPEVPVGHECTDQCQDGMHVLEGDGSGDAEEAPVEQATAAPGEKRPTRAPRTPSSGRGSRTTTRQTK